MSLDQANLLKAWQHFIEITGCEKSKIPVIGVNNCQNIIFKDSDLIENVDSHGVFIELHPMQIAHLKEKYVTFDEDLNAEVIRDQLSFAFPLLTMHKNRETFYLPLFVVELPSDFLVRDGFTGFDISSNLPDSIKVNISVLLNYFDVDIEQIDETRNFIDMVNLLCDTKHTDFKSVYEGFLRWANERLQMKNNNFNQIFLAPNTYGLIFSAINDDFSSNRDLSDFKYLLSELEKTDHKSECYVSRNYPLLNTYLSKINKGQSITKSFQVHETKIYGLFEREYSLGRGQFQSIQAANIKPELPLIAVQGAPGTGKTTLFKSLIAQQVTARALSIISGEDKNHNMLVCSTAIKAVDNVIADLRADEFTKGLSWLWFHGGSKQKIENEVKNRLEPYISHLEANEFDQNKYDSFKTKIIVGSIEINKIANQFQNDYQLLQEKKAAVPFINPNSDLDPTALREELTKYQMELAENLDVELKDKGYSDTILEQHQNQLGLKNKKLSEQINEINVAMDCVKNLLAYWPKKFSPSQFSDWMLNKKVRGTFTLSFGDFFKLQFLKLVTMFSPAKINLLSSCEVLSRHDELVEFERKLSHGTGQLKILNRLHQTSINLNAFINAHKQFNENFEGCQDLSDALRLKAVGLNRKMFEDSVQFIYQEQLKRKPELIEALSHWSAMLLGGNTPTPNFGKFIKKSTKFYNLISLAYPVVASTLASAYKMSGYKKLDQLKGIKPWNLVLLDEAGMVSVENLVPILSRSNTAMIVGDPLQLEPIRTISKPSIQKIYNEYFLNHDEEYKMLGPGQVTAYHRASGTLTGEISDIGDGIILDEHRRCQAPIAQLFIDIAEYKDLSVTTFKPKKSIEKAFNALGGHHLMFYHVDGSRSVGKTNLDEVRAIGELLNQLEEAGYDLKTDVGIITPYADQKRLLLNAYGKRLRCEFETRIGTVHQFQGTGFDVIIYSPVIFEELDSPSFQNTRPNMLNVAVSRAKQQFIVVGNYHKLKQTNGPLKIVAERTSSDFYLELGSQSPSYHDFSISFAVEKHIYDAQHIKAFEYYLAKAEKSVVIVVPWIRKPHNMPVQKQLNLIKAAKKRGIDVTIHYGYSNLEMNQKDDNDQHLVQEYIKVLGSGNVIRIPQGTHEKVLLVDDRLLVIGSWNWLSNAYYKWYETQNIAQTNLAIRRETSIIIMDRKIITDYKAHNLHNMI